MTYDCRGGLTAGLPRVSLTHLPTPLVELARLRNALPGCPRLLIKRDDQTGLAGGGNKARKLEFLIADALEQGADTVVTVGGPQSNHCRQTAAAAVAFGLRCTLVLSGSPVPRPAWNGNLLLNNLLGAEVRWTGEQPRDEVIAGVLADLRRGGARPYYIPIGGSTPRGAAGYAAAVEELAVQLQERDETVDRIVLVSGSGGTHAGVLVGVKAVGFRAHVEGMNNFAVSDIAGQVRVLTEETAAFLRLDLSFTDDDFRIHDAGGHAYGVITAAERDAIRLLARTEGILLDPIYTARAFVGLLDLIRSGGCRPDETILFWHTGGLPGLFGRAGDLLEGAG